MNKKWLAADILFLLCALFVIIFVWRNYNHFKHVRTVHPVNDFNIPIGTTK